MLGKATAQAYLQVYSGSTAPLQIPTKGNTTKIKKKVASLLKTRTKVAHKT